MQVRIEEINGFGDGIGFLNINEKKKRVVISKTAIGDLVEFETTKENKDFIFGKLINIVEKSSERVDYSKTCPVYDICGGCNLLHLNEKAYHSYKKNILENILKRLNIDNDFPTDVLKIDFNTRRRVVFQVSNGKIGFFAKNSNNIVEFNSCPLIIKPINDILQKLKEFIKDFKNIQDISITQYANGLGLIFSLSKEFTSNENKSLLNFLNNNSNIIICSYKIDKGNHTLFLQKTKPEIIFKSNFNETLIELNSSIFLQATKEGQEFITNLVLEGLAGCKNVLDLYCGVGTYSFPLSYFSRVSSFEDNEDMIDIMQENIKKNGLKNKIKPYCRNLVNSPLLVNELNEYDGIVVNPPRNGAKIQCEFIARSNIKNIVMVSCNPQTLIFDLKELLKKYKTTKIVGIDQFYKTSHLEVVCFLERV